MATKRRHLLPFAKSGTTACGLALKPWQLTTLNPDHSTCRACKGWVATAAASGRAMRREAKLDRQLDMLRSVGSVRLSPDFDAYATGQVPVGGIRCALCGLAPCQCPPFGSPAYFALIHRVHGKEV